MNTFIFQPGYTWRKAGFVSLSNSLAYREVINNNPGWDITSTPPPGSVLMQPGSSSVGYTQTSAMGTGSNADPLSYYPYDSWEDYIDSLTRYNPSTLLSVNRYNGWSATSEEVLTESPY